MPAKLSGRYGGTDGTGSWNEGREEWWGPAAAAHDPATATPGNSCPHFPGHVLQWSNDKPLPQGAPGGIIGILGGVIAAALIIGVAVTVFIIYRRQQKSRTEADNDLIDLPPSHKPAPPPKKKQEMKSHLTAEDIQVVHLDNAKQEEEIEKLPLQTPYYDMATSEPSPHSNKLNSGTKDCDVHYAELDTSALASSPSPRSSIQAGGDLVEMRIKVFVDVTSESGQTLESITQRYRMRVIT